MRNKRLCGVSIGILIISLFIYVYAISYYRFETNCSKWSSINISLKCQPNNKASDSLFACKCVHMGSSPFYLEHPPLSQYAKTQFQIMLFIASILMILNGILLICVKCRGKRSSYERIGA